MPTPFEIYIAKIENDLPASFSAWMEEEGRQQGLDPEVVKAYELANPLGMSADGLQRYWKKVRMAK